MARFNSELLISRTFGAGRQWIVFPSQTSAEFFIGSPVTGNTLQSVLTSVTNLYFAEEDTSGDSSFSYFDSPTPYTLGIQFTDGQDSDESLFLRYTVSDVSRVVGVQNQTGEIEYPNVLGSSRPTDNDVALTVALVPGSIMGTPAFLAVAPLATGDISSLDDFIVETDNESAPISERFFSHVTWGELSSAQDSVDFLSANIPVQTGPSADLIVDVRYDERYVPGLNASIFGKSYRVSQVMILERYRYQRLVLSLMR